jgi:hypothetical protein
VPQQKVPETFPAELGLARLVERLQAVPGALEALLNLRVVLAENAVLDRGLGHVPAHDAQVLAFELLGAALAADADDLVDADVEEVL